MLSKKGIWGFGGLGNYAIFESNFGDFLLILDIFGDFLEDFAHPAVGV